MTRLQVLDTLSKIIETMAQIEVLANDEWNVDDTVCQQNMKRIQILLQQDA